MRPKSTTLLPVLLGASVMAQNPPVTLTPVVPHNFPDFGIGVIKEHIDRGVSCLGSKPSAPRGSGKPKAQFESTNLVHPVGLLQGGLGRTLPGPLSSGHFPRVGGI